MDELWGEEAHVEISLVEMDKLIKDLRGRREAYDEAKAFATDLYKEYAEVEGKVIAALEAAGKKSYKVEGLGTFSIVNKSVYTVPKNLEDKRKLFAWIESNHGLDALDSMRGINHMSLNSFVNEELKRHEEDPMFTIDGLEAPTNKASTRFRKA